MDETPPTSPAATLQVFMVDDNHGYLDIASQVVSAAPGFVVAGTATSLVTALAWLDEQAIPPDVVLMDVNLGDEDGITVAAEVHQRCPDADILLVTAMHRDDLPPTALTCGARGYVPKAHLSPRTLRDALDGVYDWS